MLSKMLKKHGFSKTLKDKLSSGVLFYDVFSTALNGTDKTSLELTRLGELNKAKKKLRKKFAVDVEKPLTAPSHIKGNTVWTLWLQGENDAPDIVKTSIESIKAAYSQVIVLDARNFQTYAKLPSYIIDKWKSGQISNAHFSDLIRVQLLVEYGGVWIDSTVLVQNRPDWFEHEIEDAPLFFFQNLRPGSMGNAIFLSSWFIKADKAEPSLVRLREILFSYWQRSTKLKDYFLVHILWHLIFEAHPEILSEVPRVPNSLPLELLYRLNDQMTEKELNRILDNFGIQKITYKNLNTDSASAHSLIVERFLELEK